MKTESSSGNQIHSTGLFYFICKDSEYENNHLLSTKCDDHEYSSHMHRKTEESSGILNSRMVQD